MAFSYRSAFPALLLQGLIPLSLGCAPLEPEVLTLEIRSHSLDASERCKVLANPLLTLKALGPFPVSPAGAEVLPFRTPDRTLVFPDDTRGVEATADDGNRTWIGYSDRRSANGVDVLLWEEGVGCELFEAEPMSYPGADAGQAIGYSPETGVVLAAGGDQTLSSSSANVDAAAGSLTFDSGTGEHALVDPEVGFSEARAYATVTPFGSKLLLAGGEKPFDTDVVSGRETLRSAAIYDPSTGGFEADNIELELERTRHAAVALANGETLLVGGGRSRGDGSTVIVPPFEVISPTTRRSRVGGLAQLAQGRLEPSAIRLENDNLLVGGGYNTSREPLRSLEWFSPDGSVEVPPGPQTTALEPRYHRAFVALPGGGALTVGGCAPAAIQDAACERACGKDFGCPATSTDAQWITANGDVTPVELATDSPCGAFSPERVILAPGSDGSPWLFAFDEDAEPPCRATFRFAPWEKPPAFVRADLTIEHWPDPRTPLASIGPDAFVWLSEDDPPFLVGARAGVRGALSQNETLLTTASTAPETPLHLAPDRPPDARDQPKAIFEAQSGRLILETGHDGLPAVSVYVTDARYDDVTISIGFSSTGPPVLLLGNYEMGGNDCPWPSDATSPLVVTRRGEALTATDGSGKKTSCKTLPSGPRSLGFRAGQTNTATITSLHIERS